MLIRILQDEDGATMIEYALIAALISVVLIAVFIEMGLNLSDIFTTVSTAMASV